jgi:type IV secretory pathway protease TraF
MMHKIIIVLLCLPFLALGIAIAFSAGEWPLLMLNTSPSMPEGIYIRSSRSDIVVFKKEAVAEAYRKTTMPDWLIKRRVRTSAVEITSEGVTADGTFIAVNNKPDEAVNRYQGALPEGRLLVLGDHPDSYDSRYFGLIEDKVQGYRLLWKL